ncbi:MAG: hypothetical protein K2L96_03050 [Muribaculaceae bacterium]|nr:hypothetical protein [Muribaculaceae bacterium]
MNYIRNIKASTMNFAVALTIAITGMIVISACGGTTSVSDQEAYDAGYTIGRMLRGE